MTEQSAEEAAHARARAVIDGDFAVTIRLMTPDSLAKSMDLGITSWHYSSYELRSQRQEGNDYIFDVVYQGQGQTIGLRDRLRKIDGEWKIVDIERIESG